MTTREIRETLNRLDSACIERQCAVDAYTAAVKAGENSHPYLEQYHALCRQVSWYKMTLEALGTDA